MGASQLRRSHFPFLLLPMRDRMPADFSVAMCFLTMRSDMLRASAAIVADALLFWLR